MSKWFSCCINDSSLLKRTICGSSFKRDIHAYRNLVPWKNTLELSNYLISSVTYNDNGLLVLNKPYGVSFARDSNTDKIEKPNPEDIFFNKTIRINKHFKTIHSSYCTGGIVSDSLNLVDCLPYLKNHFNFNKLHISRVPEKYASGVAILTTSKELVDHINKCKRYLPTGKDKYYMIVVGVPRYNKGIIKLGFKLDEDPKKGKRVVLLQEWSKNAYKRGEIRIGTFHYQTLCTGYDKLTSLIEVRVELRKYHAYRVFPANYLLSPVLGDNLFGSRVQTIMGVPMVVDHYNDVADTPQRLPQVLYDLLSLSSSEGSLIPVHVHLSEMLVPRFHEKQSVLLEAPLPPHFLWTCEKLGLKESDLVRISAS